MKGGHLETRLSMDRQRWKLQLRSVWCSQRLVWGFTVRPPAPGQLSRPKLLAQCQLHWVITKECQFKQREAQSHVTKALFGPNFYSAHNNLFIAYTQIWFHDQTEYTEYIWDRTVAGKGFVCSFLVRLSSFAVVSFSFFKKKLQKKPAYYAGNTFAAWGHAQCGTKYHREGVTKMSKEILSVKPIISQAVVEEEFEC